MRGADAQTNIAKGPPMRRIHASALPPPSSFRRAAALESHSSDSFTAHTRAAIADWRAAWREALTFKSIGVDMGAGLTVAAVALPLNVALALAAGLPASSGLMAGAIGGAVAAIFGSSSFQVTGPAAALNLMVLGLTRDFGAAGVAAACLVISLIQVGLAASQAGKLMRFFPEAVLAGFTTGVGIKLLDQQLAHVLGINSNLFTLLSRPGDLSWLHTVHWHAVASGLLVIVFMLVCARWKRLPAGLMGVWLVTALAIELNWDVARVGSIAVSSFLPSWPDLAVNRWGALALATLPLALLAAIESLVSARAVDRLAKAAKPHNPSLELFGQGLANFAAGLFRGMPVTGVIVRSSVTVQCGARTRLASLTHAALLLIAVVTLADLIASVPLAALAGLLCVVGVRLIELPALIAESREHKLLGAAFMIACVGTVTGHIIIGLTGGLVLCYLHHRFVHKEAIVKDGNGSMRAALPHKQGAARRLMHAQHQSSPATWLAHIAGRPVIPPSAFVHPGATVIGRVVLGEDVHIAAGTSVRADEGAPFFIGPGSNVQDGVVMHALKDKYVTVGGERWAVYVGRGVSMAHQALVHGPCYVGDGTFIGFQGVVHDAVVGEGCFIGIGAKVIGVEIPAHRYVPHGSVITTAEQAAALPPATAMHSHFNDDVVDVNRGLAAAYHADAVLVATPAVRKTTERSFEDTWSPAF